MWEKGSHPKRREKELTFLDSTEWLKKCSIERKAVEAIVKAVGCSMDAGIIACTIQRLLVEASGNVISKESFSRKK